MAGVPKATKTKRKKGKSSIEYISNIDRTKYLMVELERAALRDIGTFLRYLILDEVRKLPGFKRGKRPLRAYQYWVRRKSGNLWIGIKHNSWYGVDQELGTNGMKKLRIITKVVMANIKEIRKIAAVYLSSIEDELKALNLIDENDEGANEE